MLFIQAIFSRHPERFNFELITLPFITPPKEAILISDVSIFNPIFENFNQSPDRMTLAGTRISNFTGSLGYIRLVKQDHQ